MVVFCGLCRKVVMVDKAQQLTPCMHTFCTACLLDKHSNKFCPMKNCYSAMEPPQRDLAKKNYNICDSIRCRRKLVFGIGHQLETHRTACGHNLCAQCLEIENRKENPLCPATACRVPLLDEDDRDTCAGPCGQTVDINKMVTMICCQARLCGPCYKKHTGGTSKGLLCPQGKCIPIEKRPKRRKPQTPLTIPCQGQPDCTGEVLRQFPSEQECDHAVCISCLARTLDECAQTRSPPICPAEVCRMPYRCESVLALRVLFPERRAYFERFQLEAHYSLEALKDDSTIHIFWPDSHEEPIVKNVLQVQTCFCEDEDNKHVVAFDKRGSLSDLLREIRVVLNIMPFDKVYGYYKRDGEKEMQLQLKPATLLRNVTDLGITNGTLISVDITGIVNQKQTQSQMEIL